MTGLPERAVAFNDVAVHTIDQIDALEIGAKAEQAVAPTISPKASLISTLFHSTFSIFEKRSSPSSSDKKESNSKNYAFTTAVKKVMTGGMIRRLQERFLGTSKADVLTSACDIWLLGVCYTASPVESTSSGNSISRLDAFWGDFSSKIWITYRKGFHAIGDSKCTSDVNWGCMIRSSQMLVAQALLFHYLGRSWRKPSQKPFDPEYIALLQLFGDSEECAYSLHNLLQAGRVYGLSCGSWVGPYAMCRTWESLVRASKANDDDAQGIAAFPMVLYVISGDEDGERGGAPVVYMDVAARLSFDYNLGKSDSAPILLLVPLVLGLDKVNPRYIPLLWETFTFPQSLGIMGGKPGASTYIVGVQDDKALYLDPHEVQTAVNIKADDENVTSTYHCSTVSSIPIDLIDPSLAIGFYCSDKDNFEDFCSRASDLADRSNGAPLFTVAKHSIDSFSSRLITAGHNNTENVADNLTWGNYSGPDAHGGEDDWQIV
ncbi:Cysteine protease ATG4A [Apostasia shenzhenica]|uniref:Cysteine protease n=1 Tax=Apostasia shenzhenica TaxID=1088818 RepID=A0A2I0AJM9_9ASPA|nr:Cysteine protease ATG4A [Apostasia shenzhenica]